MVEIPEQAVEAAEEAVYLRHERGFLIKPLIDPINMRAALTAAAPYMSGSAREQALEEAAKALDDLIDYWKSLPTFNRSYAMRSTIKVASDLRALKSQPAPQTGGGE